MGVMEQSCPHYRPAHQRVWRFTWAALSLLFILWFFIVLGVNHCTKQTNPKVDCAVPGLGVFSFQPLRENPLLGPARRTLVRFGALDPRKNSVLKEQWRIVTCIPLHAGLFHILVNLLTLIFVGAHLEREYGTLTVVAIWLASAIGGGLWSAILLVPENISVGASFPTMGLVGCTLVDMLLYGDLYVNKLVAAYSLFVVSGLHIVIGLMPNVDNWGHVGGFISGFFVSLLVLTRVEPRCMTEVEGGVAVKKRIDLGFKRRIEIYRRPLRIGGTMVVALGYILAMLAIASGGDRQKNCNWCQNLNCVETRFWDCPPVRHWRLPKKVVCKVRFRSPPGLSLIHI
ncbi:hypothetical protein CBR_g19877 [Chara braunii]|uniref:RHOMBOID-like protein n=1 Tax=Chara braunii TaxID=69332 RepID=A0A388KZ37_CHABU|nr:hypothetical protein CBR_g19877 [Chara braunii]|eukprot:GBG75242.1 hypothetical protein CBR_g19877 [Chara braunii]